MASSSPKLRPFNQLIKRLPKSRLDPVVRPAALIEIIARGFPENFELDSTEFRVLNRATRLMLHDAWALNRIFVDQHLTSSRYRPLSDVPEWPAWERKKEIDEARKRLESESACYEDIEHAMDVVVTAFQSMHVEFLYALMPDTTPIPPLQRYMCAALLKPTVRLLERKWLPVQQSANRK
jgi:hypothetical protein